MRPLGEAVPYHRDGGWQLTEFDYTGPVMAIWAFLPADAMAWRDEHLRTFMVRRESWEAELCRALACQQAEEFRKIRARA